MIRIRPAGDLVASPNPTTLDPSRRIELRLEGVYSTSPPEMADFEYYADRDDIKIEGGEPAKRRKKIEWDDSSNREVVHRVVLRRVAATDPPLAPIRVVVKGPSGESALRTTVVELESA